MSFSYIHWMQVAKEKAAQEKEAYQRQMSMSHGGSRCGGDRGEHPQVGPDGWTVTGSSVQARPVKAGDLSNFGKISKQQPMIFGPGSIFAGKKNEIKKETISRTASSSNMFSMLSSQTAEIADSTAKCTSPLSMDLYS
jgi:translation initiation factor 4G